MISRARLERLLGPAKEKKPQTPKAVRGLPSGRWLEEGVYLMEKSYPLDMDLGGTDLRRLEEASDLLSFLGTGGRTVLFDLETTGLAGGTGTYAFLAGMGTVEDNFLLVRQFFLASPAFESGWLRHLGEAIPDGPGFVTYNGKTYDLPLIGGRCVMNRMALPWKEKAHMDLLYPSRFFWRKALSDCRLGTVERHIGIRRTGMDVPGAIVPQLYSNFLRDGDASILEGVFYHNRVDILSLAAIEVTLSELVQGKSDSARELLRAGDLWARHGDEGRSEALWKKALRNSEKSEREDALSRLAMAAKRQRNWLLAIDLWKKCLAGTPQPLPYHLEIAKVCEHRLRDLPAALAHSTEALRWLDDHRAITGPGWRNERREVQHRIDRIRTKMRRQEI